MSDAYSISNSNRFGVFYIPLAKKLGIETAVFFQEINNSSPKNDWIHLTIPELKDLTSLTVDKQQRIVRILTEKGLLHVKLEGSPPLRFFKTDDEKMRKLCEGGDSND